ncbi:GAF domain-containing protein [Streptomyces sp. NPDC002851]
MTDPWVALEPGADPAERVRTVRRAHAAFTEAAGPGRAAGRSAGAMPRPVEVRPVVAESWRRSARARVCPDGTAPVELVDGDLGSYRAEHPLARVMPVFRELMSTFARDGEHLLAVCDAQGRLLWVEGHAGTRARADAMNFVPGARWAESAVGTNAPGTAVAVDRPVQVFAAEHFSRRVQPWTCAAAPLHDPRTGRVLGAVDITGGDGLAHPHSLAFVQAVARAAEAQLALEQPRVGPDTVELYALGRDEALLITGGRKRRLTRRHSELLTLLACHPEGLTGDQLLMLLYEDEAMSPVTLRAELSRLRVLLGAALFASRPYRLTVPVAADFLRVERRVAAGGTASAMSAYAGPLLPRSTAPEVVRMRRRLEQSLRTALIERGDPQLLADWAHSPWGGEDLDVWQALVAVMPEGAPERAPAEARRRALHREQSAAT